MREQQAIYKTICSPRIPLSDDYNYTAFTTVLGDEHLQDIEGIISCPGIVQQFYKKIADIRVTVFGKNVFSVKIESQLGDFSKVDFRRGARYLPHVEHNLPDDIASKCLSLVSKLGLRFGAIDLALLDDNSYVFFEVNPNGQWGWLEEKTGLPMRRSFLNLLFGKERGLT